MTATKISQYRRTITAGLGVLAVAGILAISLIGCSNPLAKAAQVIREEAASPILTLSLSDNTALNLGAKIDFGMVSVGSISDLEFTIKNTGTNELAIDVAGMRVTPNSSTEAGNFSINAVPSSVIAPNGASSFKIRFTPVSDGTKTASITIPTNDVRTPSFIFTAEGKGWPLALTTNSVTTIAQTTATGGGNITDEGGIPVTERGICWGTSPNPTTADSKASDAGLGTGSYSCLMTPLTPGALYYVRAYASNGIITGYGSQVSFTTLPATPAVPTVAAVGYPAGSGQLTVSWAAVNGASIYYDVYYDTTSTIPGSANGPTNLTTTSCTLSGLTDYSNYYVWIKAKNATGSSTSNPSSSTMVGVKVASITLNKSSATFLYGSSETLTAVVAPTNATQIGVTWGTSNGTYANVFDGIVTGGNATGTATISATAVDGQGAAASFTATTKAFIVSTAGPAGGVLFYDKGSYSDGWRYLEAASNNAGSGHPWTAGEWYGYNISGANGTAFGTGKANTAAIVAVVGTGSDSMARDCNDYVQNGYTDWFMPSRDEANQLLFVFTNSYYGSLWSFVSSSQFNELGCWSFDCYAGDGSESWTGKSKYWSTTTTVTRPIRQF